MYVQYTVHVQKGNKNIFKVVNVTSEGQLEFIEALKIHFGPKIAKTTTLFSVLFSSVSVMSAFTILQFSGIRFANESLVVTGSS